MFIEECCSKGPLGHCLYIDRPEGTFGTQCLYRYSDPRDPLGHCVYRIHFALRYFWDCPKGIFGIVSLYYLNVLNILWDYMSILLH